jgi:UDP-N-acetylmuramoylalanine--D-glutamate ligase
VETGRKILILGAAESGLGAAILAAKKGYDLFISDTGIIKEKYLTEIRGKRISV